MRVIKVSWHLEILQKGDPEFWHCGPDFETRQLALWYIDNRKARREYRKGTKFSLVRRETLEHVEFTDVK